MPLRVVCLWVAPRTLEPASADDGQQPDISLFLSLLCLPPVSSLFLSLDLLFSQVLLPKSSVLADNLCVIQPL